MILADNRHIRRCYLLAPELFADPIHGKLYALILDHIRRGELADVVTLRPKLEGSGWLDEVGGPVYLAQLLAAYLRDAPTLGRAERCADRIVASWLVRRAAGE
jgi:replicative DNA helicase